MCQERKKKKVKLRWNSQSLMVNFKSRLLKVSRVELLAEGNLLILRKQFSFLCTNVTVVMFGDQHYVGSAHISALLLPAHGHHSCRDQRPYQIIATYFQLTITETMEIHSLERYVPCNFRHNLPLSGGCFLEEDVVTKQRTKIVRWLGNVTCSLRLRASYVFLSSPFLFVCFLSLHY